MPFYEGEGWKAPKSVKVILNTSDNLHHWWAIARKIAPKKGYKIDNYVLGSFGEAALAKKVFSVLGEKTCDALEYLENQGDGGIDVKLYGQTIQVKTSSDGVNRVKRIKKNGGLIALVSDIYVFVSPETDFHNSNYVVMSLKGWCFKKELEDYGRLKKSELFDFFNLVISDEYLQPMTRLFSYLEGCKNGAYTLSR